MNMTNYLPHKRAYKYYAQWGIRDTTQRSSGNFRRQNTIVRAVSCVRKLNVRNFSSQYIYKVCMLLRPGKGSPVRTFFDTKISRITVLQYYYLFHVLVLFNFKKTGLL